MGNERNSVTITSKFRVDHQSDECAVVEANTHTQTLSLNIVVEAAPHHRADVVVHPADG